MNERRKTAVSKTRTLQKEEKNGSEMNFGLAAVSQNAMAKAGSRIGVPMGQSA